VRLGRCCQTLNNPANIVEFVLALEHPGVDFGEIEQGVDLSQQTTRIPLHRLEEGTHVLLVLLTPKERLQGAEDKRQRASELVADVGEEPHLGIVELLELLVGLFDLHSQLKIPAPGHLLAVVCKCSKEN